MSPKPPSATCEWWIRPLLVAAFNNIPEAVGARAAPRLDASGADDAEVAPKPIVGDEDAAGSAWAVEGIGCNWASPSARPSAVIGPESSTFGWIERVL